MYPNTDAGITDLYPALSAELHLLRTEVLLRPGPLGLDLSPAYAALANDVAVSLSTGYDPATGLRGIVLGSAVSQVVPLDELPEYAQRADLRRQPGHRAAGHVTGLRRDTEQCARSDDVLSAHLLHARPGLAGQFLRQQLRRVHGNGLRQQRQLRPDRRLSQRPRIQRRGSPRVEPAIHALRHRLRRRHGDHLQVRHRDRGHNGNDPAEDGSGRHLAHISGSSPAAIFSSQQIIGFYRENAWNTCLGLPIYDFGASNASFTTTTTALNGPNLIYDPTAPFLNGGSLQNVVRSLIQAAYLLSPDRLVSILDSVISAKGADTGVGLSVTTSALDFDMSSTPAAGLVEHLAVPVIATVTTTPPAIQYLHRRGPECQRSRNRPAQHRLPMPRRRARS